ncbi:MAG TPA: HAMP domain-containing sensor histidine kinase [Streptosporangiaceae bacterium]
MLDRVLSALRPSLRRRVALTFATVSVVAVLAVAGSCIAVYHVLLSPTRYYDCSSFPPWPNNNNCYYSPGSTLVWVTGSVLVIVLVVLGWWFMAGWVLRPLSATAETVRRLGPQNLGQRIRMGGETDALKELADALDDALDRLAAGYESQRRFAANASHELRTPLAVQRLLTEVAMEAPDAGHDLHRLGTQLLITNDRNERLIEGLLVLAESDRGLQGKVPVRLDELAESVVSAHEELAGQHDVTLRSKLDRTVVPGDPVLLERLIVNLVSNAITYNEPGGWVEVIVTAEPALIVRNTGPQVPAEAVPILLEPFRRLGADRYGAAAASASAWPSSAPSSARIRARWTRGRARRAG